MCLPFSYLAWWLVLVFSTAVRVPLVWYSFHEFFFVASTVLVAWGFLSLVFLLRLRAQCFPFFGSFFLGALAFRLLPLLSLGSFQVFSYGFLLPQSNLWFLPRRGLPFGPSWLPFGFSALLLVPLSCAYLLTSLRWSPSASLFFPPPVLALSPGGHFLLGGPCYSSSVSFPSGLRSRSLLGHSVVFASGVSHWSFCSLLDFHFFPEVPHWWLVFCFGGLCLPSCVSFLSLPWQGAVFLASVIYSVGFCAAVSLLRSYPSRLLCFPFLAFFLLCRCFLTSLGFSLVFVLRDTVESQFLRGGVLPLGRVCSVGCGFSVCLSCLGLLFPIVLSPLTVLVECSLLLSAIL